VLALIICFCIVLLIGCGESQYFELEGVKVDPTYIKSPSKVKKDNPSLYHELRYGESPIGGTLVGEIEDFVYNELLNHNTYYSDGEDHAPYEMIVNVNGAKLYFSPSVKMEMKESIDEIKWIGKKVTFTFTVRYFSDNGEPTDFQKKCGIKKGKIRPSFGVIFDNIKFL
jgi:hypothetical protein